MSIEFGTAGSSIRNHPRPVQFHVREPDKLRNPNMSFDTTTDSEEPVRFRRRGIDRSIGYLVAGVAVLSFFLLLILGMSRVQDLSDQATSPRQAVPEPKSAEISDSTVTGPTR